MDTVINNLEGLLLRDVRWKVKTAGPSPNNNERTELFFLGCKKAMLGNPCKGCFNSTTWDAERAEFSHDPVLMAQHINEVAPSKYITIGGGEPTDQIDHLITLCKELKKYGFHIMMYTWRELVNILSRQHINYDKIDEVRKDPLSIFILDGAIFPAKFRELLCHVDIMVDGEFKQDEVLWDGSKEDGLLSSVGSGNQIVWDVQNEYGYYMRDINKISLDKKDNSLIYEVKRDAKKQKFKD